MSTITAEGFGINDLLVSYSLFTNTTPTSAIDRDDIPWSELIARIRNAPIYIDKAHCPLISLAQYGTTLSTKGCIRHSANVQRVFGGEIDYDGEQIMPAEPARLLQQANLRSVLYTSPSHRPDRPRWRALMPFSEPTLPEKRAEYIGRTNRVLGGIASRESFTLSQSFYVGRIREAPYEVFETTGRCIDMAAEIEPLYHVGGANDGEVKFDSTPDEELRAAFVRGEDRYMAMLKLSSRWASRGMAVDDIEASLLELLGSASLNADGVNLRTRARPMAESAVKKFGETRSAAAGKVNNIIGFPRAADVAADQRTIECRSGELPRMVSQAESALIERSAGIYQRAGQMVRVLRLEEDVLEHGVKRSAGSSIIMAATAPFLILLMSECAHWVRYDGRTKTLRRVDPPAQVGTTLLSSVGRWRFPVLTGLATAPTLRSDGTLLDAPGYDPASGLYGVFEPTDFPTINPNPSKEAALAALNLLDDLFSEFPFLRTDEEKARNVRSAHSSVAIAALITAAVRTALPIAPAVGIDAAKQSSGMTTLAKAIATIVTGRDPPVLTLSDDEAEWKKCLLAILMAGDACVLIDNVDKPVDSASLCAVLTSSTYSERLLGVNQRITVPSTVTWLLTGNHLEFVGDLTSRVMVSTLDPECERPEEREFNRDLLEHVKKNRGKLLAAALTITLAYFAADRPKTQDKPSRFAQWDTLVRRPLMWLGRPDPLATQADVRDSDPKREALVGVLQAWQSLFGTSAGSVKQAMKSTAGQCPDYPDAREAFMVVAGNRDGTVNSTRLGKYLSRSVRSTEDSLRLVKGIPDPTTKNNTYAVVTVKAP